MTALRLCGAGDPVLAPSADPATARRHLVDARWGDPDHERCRARLLAFVDTHDDALLRTCVPGHVTGSAMVVDPVRRRFLLMLHAKLGRWFQPGGHADGDAALPGVAWREATEETGVAGLRVAVPAVDLDVHEVDLSHGHGESRHLHFDVRYLVVAPPDARPSANHESLDLRWAALDELAAFDVDASTVRLAHVALAALDELAR